MGLRNEEGQKENKLVSIIMAARLYEVVNAMKIHLDFVLQVKRK